MSNYQSIRFSIKERVGRITLARPPLNILNIAMMREVGECLNECMAARDMVAIVFDAVPEARVFSAGVAVEEHVEESIYQMLEGFHTIFRTLDQMGKPTIAVV